MTLSNSKYVKALLIDHWRVSSVICTEQHILKVHVYLSSTCTLL